MPYIVPLDLLTYRLGYTTYRDSKNIAWYIGDAEAKILVDTGIPDIPRMRKWHPYIRFEEKTVNSLEAELSKKVGVTAEDIDIVILTHLHWDHSCGLTHYAHDDGLGYGRPAEPRFPNAENIVQRKELEWAVDPIPPALVSYEHVSLGIKPAYLQVPLKTVTGEKEIVKGVTVFPTPGHTPGGQSVMVNTKDGPYVIAGDTVARRVVLEEGRQSWATDIFPKLSYMMPTNVIGGYVNSADLWESYKKIEKVTRGNKRRVLPGHEYSVFEETRYG